MLEKLNNDLKNEIAEMKEIEKEIKNLQARRNRKKKKVVNIKIEIEHLNGGQLKMFLM